MQNPASRLIELLENRQLLSAEVISELRRQVADTSANLPAELLARLLVDNGHLTKFQASKLIAEIGSTTIKSSSSSTDSELGLAPSRSVADAILEDDEPTDVNSIAIVDDAVPIVAADPIQGKSSPKRRSRSDSSAIADHSSEASEQKKKAELSTGASARRKSDDGSSPSGRVEPAIGALAAEVPKVVRPKQTKDNPWDSFRILGIGVVLSLVLVVGFFLVRWAVRGNADEAIKFADNAYQQRSYEDAANAYRAFTENWPTHAKSSYAKVRSVLSSVRKDSETAPNPAVGLRTAEDLLPSIRDESSLPEQQGDLAGSLVSLAEKFVTRLDATKSTDERKALMSEMDRLMTLIGDPQFFGSMQRTQLAPTLQRIDESRARILREIQRDDELKAALAEIDQQLDAKDVIQAYSTRGRLINRYPLLEANVDLSQRVLRASAIQRDLVVDDQLPSASATDSTAEPEIESRVLGNLSGKTASDLSGTIIAYQIKGAVYGIDAAGGKVLWRKSIGRGVDSVPIRLSDSPASDFLVFRPELGHFWRLEASTGRVLWHLDLAESVNLPLVLDEDIVISSSSGIVACLDAITGQSKWVKRLPQSITVGPGGSTGSRLVYQPADHSNIYVIDRRDGVCKDVYYMGHRDGAVQVPPVLVLGQLLAIESMNVDSARVRVLAVLESSLKPSQPPIPVDGNVVLPPSVDGRQVLVQSDLGNSIILDVEPTSESQPVSVTARVPKNLDSPRSVWSAFSRNQVWLAENRLARFDLIVTQGKLNRRWIQHEGDQFIAPLQLFDQTLLHARRPKGNSGVRLSASNAESGESTWEFDLGMPISLLVRTASKQVDAVTSSGHFFTLNNEPVRMAADSNPGEGKPLKQFSDPVWIDSTSAILMNLANPREYALYNSQNPNRLRVLTVPLGSAKATCAPTVIGNNVVLGLDNGTLVQFDPATGSLVGAPFQATPAKPGAQFDWVRPVYLPDAKSLIAASRAGQVIRLAAGDTLRALSENSLDHPLVSALELLDDKVVTIQSTDSGDSIAFLDSKSLQLVSQTALGSGYLSGPYPADQGLFVQTQQSLQNYDGAGNLVWQTSLPSSPVVGAPVITEDGRCVIANRIGQLWILSGKNGEIEASRDLGNVPSASPLVIGKKILIGNDDGTISIIDLPTENSLVVQE